MTAPPTTVLSDINQPNDGLILILKLVIREVLLPIWATVISELPELYIRLPTDAPTILSPFENWALADNELIKSITKSRWLRIYTVLITRQI